MRRGGGDGREYERGGEQTKVMGGKSVMGRVGTKRSEQGRDSCSQQGDAVRLGEVGMGRSRSTTTQGREWWQRYQEVSIGCTAVV
jgi:hypothetical protein